MEIWNNGVLPTELEVDDLKKKHHSYPRNKLIANVLYVRKFFEKWGSGTNKMVDLCKADGVSDPIFEEYSSGLGVIFKFKEPISVTPHKTEKATLSIRQDEILQILRREKPLSAQEIFAQLHMPPSLRTVKADLLGLKKLGLVEQQGKGPSTTWKTK